MAIEPAPIDPISTLTEEVRNELLARMEREVSVLAPEYYIHYQFEKNFGLATKGPIGPRFVRANENNLLKIALGFGLWAPNDK
jgi:hypothetical protein